ncbi:YIP1 family protein [Thermoflavimicrobium dichotomicum]|uniref:Yip1 domain-containing protein n=1 Tax=Thermoflavimicrobium dichotomicum TaxID=46223 RepID=A0A1I3SL29_9BACL|nr:YIP1 family protein [Thermoflavimicrobium dichotomicum]SFJ59498.1 Yip1 domain-containing protein [Thermoflavimicrobium dichotomicum]
MSHTQTLQRPSWIKIVFTPNTEMDKIAHTQKIVLPLILFTLIQAAIYFAIGYLEPGILQKMKFGTFAPLTSGIIFGVYGLLNVPMTLLLSSLCQKMIAYFVKERLEFKKLFILNVYLWIVILFKYLFILVTIVFFQGDFAAPVTSLAAYTQFEPAKEKLLSAIELFSIWHFILIAIGIHHIFRIPRKKAFIIAVEAYFAEAAIVLLVG